MQKKVALIKKCEEMVSCIETLVGACINISYHDHLKIDLAQSYPAQSSSTGCEQMAESIMEVRHSLELRSSLKNRLDALLKIIIEANGLAALQSYETEKSKNISWKKRNKRL